MKTKYFIIGFIILIISLFILYEGECELIYAQGRMKELGDKVYKQTDKEIEKEINELTSIDIKLFSRYWYWKNKYPYMSDEKIYLYMQMEKGFEQMKQLQKQGLNKIKWQRRFNTAKSCLKWGLLIFIAIKI